MRLNLSSLIYALPEDIDRAKKSGNFDELEAKLTERIMNPKTTPMLRDRLIAEKELMGRWIRPNPTTGSRRSLPFRSAFPALPPRSLITMKRRAAWTSSGGRVKSAIFPPLREVSSR